MTSRLRLALLPLLLVLVFSLGLLLGQRLKPTIQDSLTIPTLRSGSQLPVGTTIPPQKNESINHKVLRVIDGDTVVIDTGEHVRYLGINAPEMGQPFSQEAKIFNAQLVLNKEVRLEFDQVKKDKYGRLLAYVWVDQILVNEKLLAAGLAKILIFNNEPPLKYEIHLRAAEALAQKTANGLWQKYRN